MQLHPQVKDRLDDIEKITIRTHESAIRIIDKKGPLANPADRDHCIQYMVAVPLIFGRLTAADYEDDVAADPRIDALRDKMVCVEDKQFSQRLPRSRQALDRQCDHRRVQGRHARREEVVVEYPIGHRRRRKEGIPVLVEKFRTNLARRFPAKQQQAILDVALDAKRLEAMPVHEFVDLMVDLMRTSAHRRRPRIRCARRIAARPAARRPRRRARRTFRSSSPACGR